MIFEGIITSQTIFESGNVSVNVRDADGILYGFREATAMTDGKRPLLPGSVIQVDCDPKMKKDAKGVDRETIREFELKDGTKVQVSECNLNRWFLVEAGKAADDKKSVKPLVEKAA